MTFHNKTNRMVRLIMAQRQMELRPDEVVELEDIETCLITLTHDYSSTAMSEPEMACANEEDDHLLWWAGRQRPPMFSVALHCTYELSLPAGASVQIEQEVIRPVYECAYDRFVPVMEEGSYREVSCNVPERDAFTEQYVRAVMKFSKQMWKILTVLTIPLGVFLAVLSFLTRTLAGKIGAGVFLFLTAGAALLVYTIGHFLNKALENTNRAHILRCFDSNNILAYFHENHNE